MSKRYPMTVSGHQALKDELSHLKKVERPKIIEEIEVARAHGDLRENAEYHAAKEKYGFIVGRIGVISEKLAYAEVINPANLGGDKVIFGATVHLEDLDSGEEVIYQIVGDDEADVKIGKINYQSPIARSLVGKQEGDEVTVKIPKGERNFEVQKIEFK
jgi:transcription elongation factor GreA